MDVIEQLHKLGVLVNQKNPATTNLPLPMRLFALREAEKQIAEETEVTESTYAFAAVAGKTIYDLPAFILKPRIVEFRVGNIRYGIVVKPKRMFVNYQYTASGSIPFDYNVYENRIEFAYGLQAATIVGPGASIFAPFQADAPSLTVVGTGAASFPDEGYLEITDDQTGIPEIVHYESKTVAANVTFNNLRRGQCGTFALNIPAAPAPEVTIRYLNCVVRYFRQPEAQLFRQITATTAAGNPSVTAITLATGEALLGNVRKGWTITPGTTTQILASYYDNALLEPTRKNEILTPGPATNAVTLTKGWFGTAGVGITATLASVSEYPDAFHDLACYKAASDILKGMGDKKARDFEAEYQYRLKKMEAQQRLKTKDLYPRVWDYSSYEGGGYFGGIR